MLLMVTGYLVSFSSAAVKVGFTFSQVLLNDLGSIFSVKVLNDDASCWVVVAPFTLAAQASLIFAQPAVNAVLFNPPSSFCNNPEVDFTSVAELALL